MAAKTRPGELLPLSLAPLPLGHVRPAGWLRRQLRLQADGLSGHLDEFWPDVAQSRWIGGAAEGWERGPYWLDGMVPLALLLDDERLVAKVRRWVEYILDHQRADGWLGPVLDARARQGYAFDPWPAYLVLKALTQYQEATGEPRIVPTMLRFLQKLRNLLAEQPLRSWARYRWADLVLSVHWLYERTGEAWLLDLAAVAHDQGFDWRQHFAHFSIWDRVQPPERDLSTHVVNNAMAIKAPGVWFRQSGDPADRAAADGIIATLDRFHGQATGVFSGDEHLAGLSPAQGTELCAVVESLYSLEVLLTTLGEPAHADRLERIAYNALPATISPDMWTHQYDQQVNQVQCVLMEDRPWTSNGPRANLFGLEPNFGCCTANMHQGWPKLAAHLWLRSPDGGLAAAVYAPCAVTTEVRGVRVQVDVTTDYPFREEVRFHIQAPRPIHFPLHLRIPAWATRAEVSVGDAAPLTVPPGRFQRLDREWTGNDVITLRPQPRFRAERRFNGSVALSRGPLLLGLKIDEDWRRLDGEGHRGDWEVRPTSPWNYALALDPDQPEAGVSVAARPVGERPFSPEGAPIIATVRGRRLAEWGLERNAAAPPPVSPVRSRAPAETLTLLPFGCTSLRVAEFPLLASQEDGTAAD